MKSELNKNLYIRSIANRGKLGGLSKATNHIVNVLEAYGKEVILIETVGTGQSELEIANMADTTVIVLAPGYGDDIQAMKAGILEIGDMYIVNKSDLQGADKVCNEMNSSIELYKKNKDWQPPVLKSIAKQNEGIKKIVDTLIEHKNVLLSTNQIIDKRKKRVLYEIEENIYSTFEEKLIEHIQTIATNEELLNSIYNKKIDPFTISENIIDKLMKR